MTWYAAVGLWTHIMHVASPKIEVRVRHTVIGARVDGYICVADEWVHAGAHITRSASHEERGVESMANEAAAVLVGLLHDVN